MEKVGANGVLTRKAQEAAHSCLLLEFKVHGDFSRNKVEKYAELDPQGPGLLN